ncbi:MAG: SAM-dependent methyltransferase [Myxococcales bacterium]|nr:SAM-dependent methyltransferase [Myxococcales bacterium]
MRRDLHEENRRSWNVATRAHNSHKRDQAAFLRAGGSTLFPEELELVGELSGRSLLHLCCNSGQDTLSLARLGARVTGIDISDDAVAFATNLSEESGIAGKFERADVYDWMPQAARERRRFDRVFMTYGVLGWMSDLDALFRGIASVLEPGGRVVSLEFHPASMVFDDQMQVRYPYFRDGGPYLWADGVSDYVALSGRALTPSGWVDGEKEFKNPHPVHEFPHSVSELVNAVLGAGLELERLHEWPYANGFQPFKKMRELEGRRFVLPEGLPELPLMLGLSAKRP